MNRLLTKKQVAELLNMSVRSVDRLRHHELTGTGQGALPALRVLSAVRFRQEDVDRLIQSLREGGRP